MLKQGPKVIMNKWLSDNPSNFVGTTAPSLIPSSITINDHPSWKDINDSILMAEWLHKNPIRIYIQKKFGFSRNTLIRFLKTFDIDEISTPLDFPRSYNLTQEQQAHINKFKLTRVIKKNGKVIWKKPVF